jgi:hypothetical protein
MNGSRLSFGMKDGWSSCGARFMSIRKGQCVTTVPRRSEAMAPFLAPVPWPSCSRRRTGSQRTAGGDRRGDGPPKPPDRSRRARPRPRTGCSVPGGRVPPSGIRTAPLPGATLPGPLPQESSPHLRVEAQAGVLADDRDADSEYSGTTGRPVGLFVVFLVKPQAHPVGMAAPSRL